MTRVVQWYVDDLPNPHIDSHLSNYFPWLDLRNKSVLNVIKEMDTFKGERDIGRYSFRSDPVWHTWEKFTNETEIKFITRDENSYSDRDINIFPIRIVAGDDEVFTHPDLCPFNHLPNRTMEFLHAHPDCAIVFHDPHEAKALSSKDFVTIPSLIVKRKQYKFTNKFVFLDSRVRSDTVYSNSVYSIPNWLVLLGTSHWLQFVTHTMDHNHIDEIVRLSKRTPLFKQGRFLCYSGRFRPARWLYLNRLLEEINQNHLWLKVSQPDDIEDHIDEINEIMTYQRNYQIRYDRKSYYQEEDRQKIISLYDKLPINTFPEPIQEDNINYHFLKYFWLPNPTHYSRAFIDISCETYNEREGPYHNDLFITEKICKPLLARRPFICSANPGFYEELKRLGFITFDRWWDESFSKDGNIKIHINKIINVIKKIDSMNDIECKKMWYEMQEVLDHNQQLILYYAKQAPRFWITELKKARFKKLI